MMQLVSVDEFSSVHKQEVPAMALGKVASPRDVMPQPAVMPLASAPVGGTPKRILDILLVVLSIPFLLPLVIGVAVMLKLTDPGPLLYGHRRIGFRGREFRCWKFRTMVVNGDEVLAQHFRDNPADEATWKLKRKLVNDPRVTPLGAILRKLSLDELPQLLNVLSGEMSLVGPRPVVNAELDYYGASGKYYLATRPGLTGLWQISGRSDTTYAERVRLDRFYVTNWSLLRDMRIIALTVPAILMSRGAH